MSGLQFEIIAEIANAHQGDPEVAGRLAAAGAAAGADAVKFQVYFAEELLARTHPRYDHFRRQSFSPKDWTQLIAEAKQGGARIYCDVFGPKALDVAAAAGADGFKIHSSDIANLPLVRAAASLGRRVILSAGGSTVREIADAVDLVVRHGIRPALLHGYQSYPTPLADTSLRRIQWLQQNFGDVCDIGYMDHVAGDDQFAYLLPIMAVGAGASVIEKHITFDRAAKKVDWYSSIEPEGFRRLVEDLRRAATALGDSAKFSSSERQYRATVKKHWVATAPLSHGHVITSQDLAMKRISDGGAGSVELAKLVGRRLIRNVAEDEPVTRAATEQTVWALVVARSRSSRLPAKALLDAGGVPALEHLLRRVRQARTVDRVVLCTTTLPEDDSLAEIAKRVGVDIHRGSVLDVLGRMLGAVDGHAVDVVLRVTGDDILVDPDYVDRAVAHHLSTNAEYSDLKELPSGTEVEAFDTDLLRLLHEMARDPSGTEYLTFYIRDHADQFRISHVPVDEPHRRGWRLTLDTPEDYAVISRFIRAMHAAGKGLEYRLDDIVRFFTENQGILEINAAVRQRQTPPAVDTALVWRRRRNQPASQSV